MIHIIFYRLLLYNLCYYGHRYLYLLALHRPCKKKLKKKISLRDSAMYLPIDGRATDIGIRFAY